MQLQTLGSAHGLLLHRLQGTVLHSTVGSLTLEEVGPLSNLLFLCFLTTINGWHTLCLSLSYHVRKTQRHVLRRSWPA